MDKETFGACWHALDRLELDAYKELISLWEDVGASGEQVRDQTNVLLGIKSAKTQIDLLCRLETGLDGKTCYKEHAAW
jgi:hypothetical protein